MKWLQSLPIHIHILFLVLLMALPAVGLIIHAGLKNREHDLKEATRASTYLLNNIATELHNKVNASQQVMEMLSLLPEVRQRNSERVNPLLADLLRNHPEYSNMLMVDRNGTTWAGKTPDNKPINLADRKAFKDAMETGRFSSGEYTVGRATNRPIINFALPFKDDRGLVDGVILVGFDLENIINKNFENLPAGTAFGIFDHQGIFLYRTVDADKFVGKRDRQSFFEQMEKGQDQGIMDIISNDGIHRIASYRQLRLSPDLPPYAYVRGGTPIETALKQSKDNLVKSLVLMALVLVLVSALTLLLSRRLIVNRIIALQDASQRLAAGDLQVRIAEQVQGGELGQLGQTFDDMAASLAHEQAERKQAEKEQLVLERQLLQSQKMESLGVLAGGIAHDFNNILTVILGNTELAMMRLGPESPVITSLKRIEKSAMRAADLSKQMLAYSGKGKFVVAVIDINQLVQEIGHLLEVSISKKATLHYNLTQPLPTVKVDATQIRQIVMNLVINASEALGENNGTIIIATGYKDCDENYLKAVTTNMSIEAGPYVYLEIGDTGCGMDKETLAKIFDPFFTTKFTGRGLGMSAVQGIVRGHKGFINVYSEPDKGTTFKVFLPASGKTILAVDDQTALKDGWTGKGKVLLVDDEEEIRTVGTEILQGLGFTVIAANDGYEAIEKFKSTTDIALVILDLTMPRMGGEECFCELIRLNPEVKVVIASGFSEHEVALKFAGKGIAAFIQKPYQISTLKEAMQKI